MQVALVDLMCGLGERYGLQWLALPRVRCLAY
jgi:hypothetical protein